MVWYNKPDEYHLPSFIHVVSPCVQQQTDMFSFLSSADQTELTTKINSYRVDRAVLCCFCPCESCYNNEVFPPNLINSSNLWGL